MRDRIRTAVAICASVLLIALSGCQRPFDFNAQGLPQGDTLEIYGSLFGKGLDQVAETLALTGLEEEIEGTGIWVPDQTVAICGEDFQLSIGVDPATDALLAVTYGFETDDLKAFGALVEAVLSAAREAYGDPVEDGFIPKLSTRLDAVKEGQDGSWFEGWAAPHDVGVLLSISIQNQRETPYLLILEFLPNGRRNWGGR